MNVIIPVAGLGTRLRPHTHTKPKPLVTVAGKPVLGHILDQIQGLPIEEMVFVVGYLGEQIEDYVGENYGFRAHYVEQKELKGQAHAIYLAREHVKGPVLIIFVDTIVELEWRSFLESAADGVIPVKEVADPSRFGVVTVEDGLVRRFVEKPAEPVSNLAVVGVYYLKEAERLFAAIEELMERNVQTEGEFFLADALQILVDRGARLAAYPIEVWEDCGTVDALLQTNRYLLRKLVTDGANGTHYQVIPPVQVDPSAVIENAIIGPYVSIGPRAWIKDCRVGPYVSIARGASLEQAIVRDSIINEGARIEEAMLTGSLIGNEARVKGSFDRLNVGDSSAVDSSLRVVS